jgi:hypothetical protein
MFDKIPRRRWGIAVLLGFGILVNYFDRVNLSVSRDALRDSFGISTVMFGFLLSVQLAVHGAATAVGIVAGPVWCAASGNCQHDCVERRVVCGGWRGRNPHAVRIAIFAGDWGGTDVSGKREGGRILVSQERTDFGHCDV